MREDWQYSEALIRVLLQLGLNLEALQQATKSTESWPQEVSAKLLVAEAKLALHDTDGALAALAFVIGAASNPTILAMRARIHRARGAWELARKDLALARQTDSQNSALVFAQAEYDAFQGEAREALAQLKKMPARKERKVRIAQAAAFRRIREFGRARKELARFVAVSVCRGLLKLELGSH